MKILDIAPWVRCLSCGAPIQIGDWHFEAFFSGTDIQCPSCKQSVDWWQTAQREVSENFMFNQAFGLVSARSTIFRVLLKSGTRTSYRLTDFGIPPDAKVLYVNYTPSGPLFPAELHGNVVTAKRSRQEVYLWPVPPRNDQAPADTEVSVFCYLGPTLTA